MRISDWSSDVCSSDLTSYGLSSYVQTGDPERAKRVARQLRSGMVQMNGAGRAAGSPFGGYKQSGNGREGGKWGLEDFLEVKAVSGWPLSDCRARTFRISAALPLPSRARMRRPAPNSPPSPPPPAPA